MKIYKNLMIFIATISILCSESALPMKEAQAQNPVICQLKERPEVTKIGYLQGEGGELELFESFIKQLMHDYSENEKNIYCGFNNHFVVTQQDRKQVIGKEFLRMETRFRKNELNLVVAYDATPKLIGASFFKIENNGAEIFIESFFINDIYNSDLFKTLYKEMVTIMGKNAPNAVKIRIKARTVPRPLESTIKELGLRYYSDKREWVHEAQEEQQNEIHTQPQYWYSPFTALVPLPNFYTT